MAIEVHVETNVDAAAHGGMPDYESRLAVTETAYFMVSENISRFDVFVLTFHMITPVDCVSGLVAHGFALRQ